VTADGDLILFLYKFSGMDSFETCNYNKDYWLPGNNPVKFDIHIQKLKAVRSSETKVNIY
jgi:hypothetical protein